ncbi:hypothetical protein DV735_g2802, partial [Chaetothyriales sp. CBS 134920]
MAAAAAELLGTSLLAEVQEECAQDVLKRLRHTLQPQPTDVLGCERIDRLLELFRYPSTPSSLAGQAVDWTTNPDVDDNSDHIMSKQRPAVIQLTSSSSSSSQSSPGKTSLLYFLAALCVLPSIYGGKGSAAVWIDNDARFSAQHLSRVMGSILRGRAQDHANASSDPITAQELESTVSSSLAQLHIIKPSSSSALLTSLVHLPTYLLSSSAAFNRPLGIVILDSANAFSYQDRQAADLARFMTLDDCLRDRSRRQQALATGRVRVLPDLDSADPTRRHELKRLAGAGFVIRVVNMDQKPPPFSPPLIEKTRFVKD